MSCRIECFLVLEGTSRRFYDKLIDLENSKNKHSFPEHSAWGFEGNLILKVFFHDEDRDPLAVASNQVSSSVCVSEVLRVRHTGTESGSRSLVEGECDEFGAADVRLSCDSEGYGIDR